MNDQDQVKAGLAFDLVVEMMWTVSREVRVELGLAMRGRCGRA
jgi:hypothetical protein